MKVLFSAFTGYNFRELLLPLKERLDNDSAVASVLVVTPGAPWRSQLFPGFGEKYTFLDIPPDEAAYRDLLANQQPDIVVTPTAGLEPLDIPLINAAKRARIPTLTFVASWDNVYKMERRLTLAKYKQQYAIADHFAVWNADNRDHLLAIIPGLPAIQVTITGPPRLDYLAQAEALPSRAQLFSRLGFPGDSPPLVHIATTELYPSDYIVKTLAQHRRNIKQEFTLFVSVHPGGRLAPHQQYSAPFGARAAYSFGRLTASPLPAFQYAPTLADIRWHAALFQHSALLINHSSTVTIESLLADTPVINVKYGRRFDGWRWYRSMVYRDFRQHARVIIASGATRVARRPRQLVRAVRDYLADPARDRAARRALALRMVTFTDGQCSARLLDLIKKIGHAPAQP